MDVLVTRWRIYGRIFRGDDKRILIARGGPLRCEIPFGVDPRARDGVSDVVVLA